MKKHIKTIIFIICFLLLAGCGKKKEILISGKTMGTTYSITIVSAGHTNFAELKEKIDKRLKEINMCMSTYIKESEISRFNASNKIKENFFISDDFITVVTVAENLYKLTNGAWDGTINPLVDLWGFGKSESKRQVPGKKKIDELLNDIGFNKIIISKNSLKKKTGAATIDLASIAKGYAVDQIADLVKKNKIDNFLVEIGGEVYASGFKIDGNCWKIGINTPVKNTPYNKVYKIITLHNKALATSGDYRNYFEVNGKSYSHILDPRTGYPVTNGVTSVSVIAENCAFADGLATAVMVLGRKKGLELINRLDDVEGLIVVRENAGVLTDYYSKTFSKYSILSAD